MNKLQYETSPYLLQHKDNPVNWYPWGDEAFQKAKAEDKPVFLSIGYSTCHWCHVMAHESFEDEDVARILNEHYVCVKVDKEERPDIDSIYMSACMAMTGSGGWPTTVMMDHTGKPFFAGTYFPKTSRLRMPGLIDILETVADKWTTEKAMLLQQAERITDHLNAQDRPAKTGLDADALCEKAAAYFRAAFDRKYGGFGRAPKFPTPHNLLFLLMFSQANDDADSLSMVQTTLHHMARGGIFDHIGFGFSRYSTDEKWLAPHFEKMLYDNALLTMAYTKAYEVTGHAFYRGVAEKTILYIRREMTAPEGGFYSAQDADSDGVEGKYYVFTPDEIIAVLGEKEGKAFCEAYDITPQGNFEGKSIPNQIDRPALDEWPGGALNALYEYRKTRTSLHKDDKILTAWNALMIAALADAATAYANDDYLIMARRAVDFIETRLCENDRLFASYRDGRRGESGFIDDYACFIYALLRLYHATLGEAYLERAKALTQVAIADFFDHARGGFYLYGNAHDALIARPKESYDGAIPSGNSVMAMNLVILSALTGDREYETILDKHVEFMNAKAADMPGGHSFYLLSLLQRDFPERKIVAVLGDPSEKETVKANLRGKGWIIILDRETEDHKLKDAKTTYYVCERNVCNPPVHEL